MTDFMKVLFVATVTVHIKAFHTPCLKWFKERGWETHVAALGQDEIPYCDVKYDVPFRRSPFSISNIEAYFRLKDILRRERFDIIHCHTPMGGVLARLCGKGQRKKGTRIIYTAHGFHFYKGAPMLNWLVYYPIEKWMSRHTDTLITINREDYELAKKKMKTKDIRYVPGVGVDTERFTPSEESRKTARKNLDIADNTVLVFSAGELSPGKNHETAIRVIAKLNDPNIRYCIAGEGKLEGYLNNLTQELKLNEKVIFLGFITNVSEWCSAADIFLFPSKREGLPVALMEAMAAGLPCVVSGIRGNTDLIEQNKGGYLCDTQDIDAYVAAIKELAQNENARAEMGEHNRNVMAKYDLSHVMKQMADVYLAERA